MFAKKVSLRQMSLSDKERKIELMSEYDSLKWFKNIFLLSSIDDGYAPLKSAKIFLSEINLKSKHNRMVLNFWNNVQVAATGGANGQAKNVTKMACYLPGINRGFSKYIGREAHVNILENFSTLKIFFNNLKRVVKEHENSPK